jgi:hypothetical protein
MNLRQDINLKELPGQLRDALSGLRLSLVEAVFLLAALGFAGFVAYFYIGEVQPLNGRIEELKTQQQQMLLKAGADKKRLADMEKQRNNAERILSSLATFEAYLRSGQTGKAAIIDEFDALAKKHKILTGDFAFRPVEAQPLVDEKGQPLKDAIRNERVNVYPALGIDTSVIGDYPNLRRFLAELEKSRQFLIVNAVTFQGEGDKIKLAAATGGKGRMPQLDDPNSIPVTLKIEMETYFRKE